MNSTHCNFEVIVNVSKTLVQNFLLVVDPHTHIFLGRAFVDLVPLRCGLRSVCGWYNITDLAGDIRGQLKVWIVIYHVICM